MKLKKINWIFLMLILVFISISSVNSAELMNNSDNLSISHSLNNVEIANSNNLEISNNHININNVGIANDNLNVANDDINTLKAANNKIANLNNESVENFYSNYKSDIQSDDIITQYALGDPIYVSLNGHDDSGDGSSLNPYKSINHAVKVATNGSVIYLNEGVYSGENNTNISINKILTIQGIGLANNTIIDGSQDSSIGIFNIFESNCTLNSLTISNENNGISSNITKGAVFIYNSSNVNIYNYIFLNNSAYRGAAISNLGNLTIINSSFINNNGGAIYNTANLRITNSKFYKNNASIASAIANIALSNDNDNLKNEANLEINNCSFENNTAKTGIISNEIRNYINNSEDSAKIIINNSVFSNNKAEKYGGVIYNRFYYADDSSGIANTDVKIDNSKFISNEADNGGVIYSIISNNRNNINNLANFEINKSEFINNKASIGGVIFQYILSNGTNSSSKAYLKSDECNFINNIATSNNGGNLAYSSANNISSSYNELNITYSNIIDNNVSLSNIGGNINSNYNWWGTNANIINKTAGSNINIDNQVIMTINPKENSTISSDSVNITASLSYYNNTNGELILLNKFLPSREVLFSTNPITGNFTANKMNLTNGKVDTLYSGALENSTLAIQIDNQVLNLNLVPSSNITTTYFIVNGFTTYKLSGENFTAKLLDKNNNSLVGFDIKFTLKNALGITKDYWATTNIEGIAKLPIKLAYPGQYFITAIFEGKGIYNHSNSSEAKLIITEKETNSILIADDFSTKKLSGENFTVKLINKNQNPIIGKEILLVLYNKIGQVKEYWSTTNTEGIAKLPINLAYPSIYYVISSFDGDNVYDSAGPINSTLTITD